MTDQLSVNFANTGTADYCRYALALLQTLDLALDNQDRPLEADASSCVIELVEGMIKAIDKHMCDNVQYKNSTKDLQHGSQ